MDWFSPEFWSGLFSIVVIDLVLAGDNAIIIGMAARQLPREKQTRVIVLGTIVAIVIRALLTFAVVWLLRIPFLLLAGGLILIWIAFNLLNGQEKKHDVRGGTSLLGAIRTIVVADVVMGLDNVIAIAGASHGSFLLVILGLIISVPVIIWGSTIMLKLIDRYPIITYIGAAVLAWTAAKMITDEPMLAPYFAANEQVKWGFMIAVVLAVLLLGRLVKNRVNNAA